MSGTIPLSLTQQFDPLGNPLSGGQLALFVAGTVSTPQNAFKDLALTLPWPNPITLDVAGRVPQLFIADGYIKIRLISSDGVVQLVADNVQVIGASSGGSGGASIDATTVAQTGDLKARYGVGVHTGWVRCNGSTIGSPTAIPAATEFHGTALEAQPLFLYLYAADPNLVVTGGRSGNALNDWNAGKTIALPDWRGHVIGGLDDMGATAAGRLTETYFGTAATVLGAAGGLQTNTLTGSQLGSHAHPANISDPGHTHNLLRDGSPVSSVSIVDDLGSGLPLTGGGGRTNSVNHSLAVIGGNTGVRVSGDGGALDVTGTNIGGNQPHANVQPTKLATIYIKL